MNHGSPLNPQSPRLSGALASRCTDGPRLPGERTCSFSKGYPVLGLGVGAYGV